MSGTASGLWASALWVSWSSHGHNVAAVASTSHPHRSVSVAGYASVRWPVQWAVSLGLSLGEKFPPETSPPSRLSHQFSDQSCFTWPPLTTKAAEKQVTGFFPFFPIKIIFLTFKFYLFIFPFMAAPVAYGNSQARGRVWAMATPGLSSICDLHQIFNPPSHNGNSPFFVLIYFHTRIKFARIAQKILDIFLSNSPNANIYFIFFLSLHTHTHTNTCTHVFTFTCGCIYFLNSLSQLQT